MALLTPEGRLSYPKVFVSALPHNPKPTDRKAWSTALLFEPDALKTDEFKAMVAEAARVALERFGKDCTGKIEFDAKGESFMLCGRDTLRMPFRRNNRGTYDESVAMFINARKVDDPEKGTRAPTVIGRNAKPITDHNDIYPGVRARLSLSCFGYSANGNKGVSFGLNNVQKLGEAARIDGFKSAEDEFGALPEEAAAAMPGEDPGLAALIGS